MKKNKRRHTMKARATREIGKVEKPAVRSSLPAIDVSREKLAVGIVLVASFVWAYGSTMMRLVEKWNSEPDYSHGFLVPPLALIFLWVRRDRFPGPNTSVSWPGLILILLSVLVRIGGELLYVDAVDGWSMLLWLAGTAWLLGGHRVLWWSAPSIGFLFFMVPLPYKLETMASLPLQRIATKLSCFTFQFLGHTAFAEGNTIQLGEHQLEVEQACSGLSIFVGIVALAFAYIIVIRRAWWEKVLLLGCTLPVALIANSARIVTTGFLLQYASGEAAKKFTHDFSGWVMIPFAALLFWIAMWYLGKLFPLEEYGGLRATRAPSTDSNVAGI